MTDRSLDHPHAALPDPEPTRDIRLPPMAGRAPSALPPEWMSNDPAAVLSQVEEPLPAAPPEPPPHLPDVIADQPTDQLAPPEEQVRQRTLAFEPVPVDRAGTVQPPFGAPGQVGAPVRTPGPPVAAAPRRVPRRAREGSRTSTWVLLVLLPVVVIVAAGLLLFFLLNGG